MLYYIWENQYFDKKDLCTYQGQPIQVIHPGVRNINSGPDFSDAQIKLGSTVWAGAVEIHVKSTEWKVHGHHLDVAYDQVILHVVWVNNLQVRSSTGMLIPALELCRITDEQLLRRYSLFLENAFKVPCARLLPSVPDLVFNEMLDITFKARVQKAAIQTSHLYQKSQDWEQVSYFICWVKVLVLR